jgi:hypothetical protein
MQQPTNDFVYVGTMDDDEYYLSNGEFFIRICDGSEQYWVAGVQPGSKLLNRTNELNRKRLLLIQRDHKHNNTPADYIPIMQFIRNLFGDMFGVLKHYYDAIITMQPWNIRPNKRPVSDLVLFIIDMRNMHVVSKVQNQDYSIYHFAGIYQNGVHVSYCLMRSHDLDDEDTWHHANFDYPPLIICDCLALRYQEMCSVEC